MSTECPNMLKTYLKSLIFEPNTIDFSLKLLAIL